jgi:hypothetical protein
MGTFERAICSLGVSVFGGFVICSLTLLMAMIVARQGEVHWMFYIALAPAALSQALAEFKPHILSMAAVYTVLYTVRGQLPVTVLILVECLMLFLTYMLPNSATELAAAELPEAIQNAAPFVTVAISWHSVNNCQSYFGSTG